MLEHSQELIEEPVLPEIQLVLVKKPCLFRKPLLSKMTLPYLQEQKLIRQINQLEKEI